MKEKKLLDEEKLASANGGTVIMDKIELPDVPEITEGYTIYMRWTGNKKSDWTTDFMQKNSDQAGE